MNERDDEALLAELGAALSLDVAPSPQEIAEVRELVVSNEFRAVVVPLLDPRPRARLPRVAAAAAVVVLCAVGVAALAGTSMPGSMRDPARAVGLPVQSQEMTEARSAVSGLRLALLQPNSAHVVAAADLLRARLRAVSADEMHQLNPEATDLLHQADERLHPPDTPAVVEATDTVPSDTETAPPRAAVPAPTSTTGSVKGSAPVGKVTDAEEDTEADD